MKSFFSKILNTIFDNKILYLATTLATFLFFYAAYESRQVFTNQDGLSYVAIAQYYANGNFEVALNAYWSPFVSWLMIPLVAIGLDGLLSFMLVNAIAATIILFIGVYFIRKYSKGAILPVFFIATIAPFLTSVISQTTPDIWLSAWVVLYLLALIKVNGYIKPNSQKTYLISGVILGTVGALGYFIKLYALPVFAVSLIGWSLLNFVTTKPTSKKAKTLNLKMTLILVIVSFITFLAFISPWVIALSNKYGTPTYGSSLAHNTKKERAGILYKNSEELKPRFPQDPTYYGRSGTNKPQGKINLAKYYVKETIKALPYYLNRIASISPLILFVAMAMGFAILFGKIKYSKPFDKTVVIAAILFSVYFLGYALVTGIKTGGGNARYYWPLFPIVLIVAVISLPKLWAVLKKQHLWQKIVFLGLVLLLPFSIYTQYAFGIGHLYSFDIRRGPGSEFRLEHPPREYKDIFDFVKKKKDRQTLAEEIESRNIIESGEEILSNNERATLYIAYETKSTSYSYKGTVKPLEGVSFIKNLQRLGIDYYIDFSDSGTSNLNKNVLKKYQTIFETDKEKFRCDNTKTASYEKCHITIIKI